MKRGIYALLLLLVGIGLCPSEVRGQAVTANLVGTITDQTGAIVLDATVTITEIVTGISKAAQTNGSGNYDFEAIQPGNYRVVTQKEGFSQVVSDNAGVVVNATVRVDLVLHSGAVTESIHVTEAPPALQTDRADVSLDISSVEIENLPLSTNRNFLRLSYKVEGTFLG